jgi:hypothetical protein
MNNATSFWPSGSTNNGNQNGIIEQGLPNSSNDDESVLAWQHMGLAGILNGNYSGKRTGGSSNNVVGIDVPASKYGNNSGWYFDNQNCYPTLTYMTIGGSLSGDTPHADILTTKDAYNVDQKIDDGLPQKGKILSPWYDAATPGSCVVNPPCVITSTNSYNLSNTAILCILHSIYN